MLNKEDSMKSYQICAKELRNKENLNKIPKNQPGFYKWWCPKDALESLLSSKHLNNQYMNTLITSMTKKKINNKDYYYIYVGVAIRESIKERLNWHVNQHHTITSVKSGFLSTLRQTISSLVAHDQYNEDATNTLIDKLVIEYYPFDLPIKSEIAKTTLEEIEKNEINSNVLPLNLKDNKNIELANFHRELKAVRKSSKLIEREDI